MRSILSILLLLLVVGALYLFFRPILPAGTVRVPAAVVLPSDAPGYNLYTDATHGFSFAFPTDLVAEQNPSADTATWSMGAATGGTLLAAVRVPQEYAPGTNFSNALFTVGTSTDFSAMASCLSSPFANQGQAAIVTIGDVSFTKLSYAGAATGNRYDTTSYRTIRGGECWAVEYTIHSGNIGNYPAGAVKEFNEPAIAAVLDEIARSFTFLPNS